MFKIKRRLPKRELYRSTLAIVIMLAGAVFIIEILVMVLLSFLPSMSDMASTVFDASLLTILLSPLLYFLAFRPMIQNINEREQSESDLKLAASVFTYAREGIMITNRLGDIIAVNDAFSQITGFSRLEVLGKNPRILQSGRQSVEFYAAMWQALIQNGCWSGEVWNRRKCGNEYAEILTISAVKDDAGETQHYVALLYDITAIKEHQQQLEQVANFDDLTGLPNRSLLRDRLEQCVTRSQRQNVSTAVVYIDLDGFKAINDKYGHDFGDELLVSVAKKMQLAIREEDSIARIGGDEFVGVLTDIKDDSDFIPVIDRILRAVSEPLVINGIGLQISASIGITSYPHDLVDTDMLLRHADQAMYQAKLEGKNRFHIFDVAHHDSVITQRDNLESIRNAIIQNEFVLYYQPKTNSSTGKVIGAEALIRWLHPLRGFLPPSAFLADIEGCPVSIQLGEWVINTALTQMAEWRSIGLEIPVSVNIDVFHLEQTNFVNRLTNILNQHLDVPPSWLELEVLESSAIGDMSRISEIMNECRSSGVKFALDDFGTGYSSLTYLKNLPADTLKIDQSFVRDMLVDKGDLALVQGIIGLSSAFNRTVIAEGVETPEHSAMLLSMGCELVQGYGIARPMPATELPSWIDLWQSKTI